MIGPAPSAVSSMSDADLLAALNKSREPDFLTQAHEQGMKSLNSAIEGVTGAFSPSRDRGSEGILEGPLKTGKGVLSALSAPFMYPYGAASSLIANPMASAIHETGKLINPEVANKQTQQQIYNDIQPGVETALSAVGARRIPVAPKAPPPSGEVAQAAARLSDAGYPVDIPRVVSSDSLATQQAGAQLRNIPVIGDPIIKSTEKATRQMGGVVEKVAAEQGGASMERSGEVAQAAIKDWITGRSKDAVKTAYDAVDNAVSLSARADLNNTRTVIADIAAKRQNAQIPGNSKAVDIVLDAVQSPNGLNYSGVKDLRTYLGELLEKPQMLPADIRQSELKQIYGALTKDLENVVRVAGGTRGEHLWKRANSLNAAVQKRREELAKIVGMSGDVPPARVFERLQAAASSGSRADTALLTKARQAIGQDWDEVVSGITARLGQNAKGEFSPAIYLNSWEKLSDNGKAMLFTKDHRSALEDLAKISHRTAVDLQKFANPSGTGRASWTALGLTGAMSIEPLTMISTALGGNALARILSKPASARSLAKWAQAQQASVIAPSPRSAALLTISTRNLANTVSHDLGVSAAEILKSLQGPMGGRAEDEQP